MSDSLSARDRWFRQNWTIAETEHLHGSVPPVPPLHILNRTGGGDTPTRHLRSGIINWLNIVRAFEENGATFRSGQRILEFGCGGGRILRHFNGYKPELNLYGIDIDGPAIEWDRSNLSFARFAVGPTDPPTDYENNQFDMVYAFSVFSHLPEVRHFNWLRELRRITKPSGHLVLTIMGENCFDLYANGQRPNSQPTPAMLEGMESVWKSRGFLFLPYGKIDFAFRESKEFFDNVDMDTYGSTFITSDYVRANWSKHFDVLEIRRAPDEWQDYVVLRRK